MQSVITLGCGPRDGVYATNATLEFASLDEARLVWRALARRDPGARLYHRERWLELLRRAYGFELTVAMLRSEGEVRAGCIMAASKRPLSRRFVSLPFSDSCPPLALEPEAADSLVAALASCDRIEACEIRGVAAPPPWQTVDCFLDWELDLSLGLAYIDNALATNFRRNLKRARSAGVKVECGIGERHLQRFYALHSESRRRQGMPCQPTRFFSAVRDAFGGVGDAAIWFGSAAGRDLAATLVLRDGDCIYYKWSARSGQDSLGASHLIAWSIVEEFAGKARALDLGRTDARNTGLNRFKRELGAAASPLPYSFFPHAPQSVSSEVLSGPRAAAAQVWRHMPRFLCRTIGNLVYPYLS